MNELRLKETTLKVETEEQKKELIKALNKMEFRKELVKSWEGLETVRGFWIGARSGIEEVILRSTKINNLNIFKTEKQAKKSLAMAQLSQLMADANGDWVADWGVSGQNNHCVIRNDKELKIFSLFRCYEFIALKDRETAEHFIKHHERLIKDFYEMD